MDQKKILVVDDEPLTCQLIAKILKLQGYNPTVLADHEEIMSVVEAEKPALILIDYHLGTAHGLELMQLLKQNSQTEPIPVIITSGMNRKREALEAGAQGFLLKPFDWKQLAKIINRFLE